MAINILQCYQSQPAPLEFVLPGFAPGTVGSIVSPGGSGKSILALQIAHLIGGGVDLLGFGTFPTGRVIYLSAEDGKTIFHHRLYAIGTKLNNDQRHACAENIVIEDLTAHDPDLANPRWIEALENAAEDTRLLILDTLRAFHKQDENSATAMAQIVSTLKTIAARTGCTILFLHHSSKALATQGQGDSQQAARGSSVLTDNIRWQSYLVNMTKEEAESSTDDPDGSPIGADKRSFYVRFGISKQNYGIPFEEKWFHRGQGGILEPARLRPTEKRNSKDQRRNRI
jgi:regulatory protein RepA